MPLAATLGDAARHVLLTADPDEKCTLTRQYAAIHRASRETASPAGESWMAGLWHSLPANRQAASPLPDSSPFPDCSPLPDRAPLPDRPARPDKPLLLAPRDMPKRSTGPGKGRAALVHALCHIELNAIDLAWDIVARFASPHLPDAFYDDWVQVADDEAVHFRLLADLLAGMDCQYGSFPAHDGLWEAASQTAHSLAARLSIVPCTHEARGLDTTPATIRRLLAQGETALAEALEVIYRDEISHVAAGVRWLRFLAGQQGCPAEQLFADNLARHYKGGLKPPFNEEARSEARMPPYWYLPLSRQVE